MGREGKGIRWGGEGKGGEGRGGEKGRGRSSPNVRDALTPLVGPRPPGGGWRKSLAGQPREIVPNITE